MLDGVSFTIAGRATGAFHDGFVTAVPGAIDFMDPGEGSRIAVNIDILDTAVILVTDEGSGRFSSQSGYSIEFEGVGGDANTRIRDAAFIPIANTLEIPDGNLSFNDSGFFVDAGGLGYSAGQGWAVQLGFDVLGVEKADLLVGGAGPDRLTGKAGADVLVGAVGTDTLVGGSGADRLSGGGQDDRLSGGRGSDLLEGDAGADRLVGGRGNDTLDGGTGKDVLKGGLGQDTFVLSSASGRDRVTDFEVDLDIIAITTGASSLDDLAITTTRGGVRLSDDGGSLFLANVSSGVLEDITFEFA